MNVKSRVRRTRNLNFQQAAKPKPHKPRPDSIVMIADTMGSTETDSTDALHKMWINDGLKIYAVASVIIEYRSELFMMIEEEFKKMSMRSHGEITSCLNRAFQVHRAQHFQWDVIWARLQIPSIGPLVDNTRLQTEWESFYPTIYMIVGTFDATGLAHIYYVGKLYGDSHKAVHLAEFPGYATIGTGGDNANF